MARVLVADDDRQVRTLLSRMLERAGHDAVLARDGLEAVDLYRESPADVVILDLYMPEQEGLETLLELRTDFPESKVIVISGGGGAFQLDPLRTAERLGAVRALTKPIDWPELGAAIDQALEG